MSVFGEQGKGGDHAAMKRNRRSAGGEGKYAYHCHFHGDWLRGVAKLTPEERGVYQTLIDLQYENRGPLPDDDGWLARQNNCPLRTYRRIKAQLIAKGRIVVDAEAGTIFDQRAMRELAAAGVVKEQLASRGREGAKKRWRKQPAQAAAKAEVRPEKLQLSLQQVDKYGDLSLQQVDPCLEENQAPGSQSAMAKCMATHYPLPIETPNSSAKPPPPAPGAPPATLTGGGAPPRLRKRQARAGPEPGAPIVLFTEADRAAKLAAYRAALAEDAA